MRRSRLVREIARFTTTDGLHHLLSFGEKARAAPAVVEALRLWQPLTGADAVFVGCSEDRGQSPAGLGVEVWLGREVAGRRRSRTSSTRTERAEVFRAAVPRVARALANVATYMVYDDHEMTDDWYLSQSWRSRG